MEKRSIDGGGSSRLMSSSFHWSRLTLLVWLLWLVGCSGEQPGGVKQGLGSRHVEPTTEAGVMSQQRPTPAAALSGGKHAVWVLMKESASLTTASKARGWRARGSSVYNSLTSTASTSQAALKRYLDQKGTKYKAHWIANAIRVEADEATIAELKQRSDVARVFDDGQFEIPQPIPSNGQSVDTVE